MILNIYLIGVVLACIVAMINYWLYLKQYNIKYPHWLFYANEIFWMLLLIGGLSWIGFVCAMISIYNRCSC